MRQRPLALCCLAFLCGSLLTSFSSLFVLGFALLLLLFTVLFFTLRRPLFLKIALVLAFALLGSLRLLLERVSLEQNRYPSLGSQVVVTGVSCSRTTVQSLRHAKPGESLASFVLEVESIEDRTSHQSTAERGYVQVFLTTEAGREIPHYGQRLRLSGQLDLPEEARNPGGFDYRRALAMKGIGAVLGVKAWGVERVQEGQGNPIIAMGIGLRDRILNHFSQSLTPDQNTLLTGILFGERSTLSGARLAAFEKTGTVHILATAGLHVGIVALLLVALFRWLHIPRHSGAMLSIGLLILYAIMAEGRPAVVRAVVIACVYLFARVVEREPDWWNALALAALILTMMHPLEIFEAGFQLSFATVITLVIWMPLCQKLLSKAIPTVKEENTSKRILRRFVIQGGDFLLVAFVAQVGVLPLIALYYHTFSLTSIPANAIVVPCIAPIMGLGFLSALGSLVSPALVLPCDRLIGGLLDFVMRQVEWWGEGAGGVLSVPLLPLWLIWLYYGVLWGGGLRLRGKH